MSFADEVRHSVKKPQPINLSYSELEQLEDQIISTLVEDVKKNLKSAAQKGLVRNGCVSYSLSMEGIINKEKKPSVGLTYYEGVPFSYCIVSTSSSSLSRIINGVIHECKRERIKLWEGNIFTASFETLGQKKRSFIEGKGKSCSLKFYVNV